MNEYSAPKRRKQNKGSINSLNSQVVSKSTNNLLPEIKSNNRNNRALNNVTPNKDKVVVGQFENHYQNDYVPQHNITSMSHQNLQSD